MRYSAVALSAWLRLNYKSHEQSKSIDSTIQELPEAIGHAESDFTTEELTLLLNVDVVEKFKVSGDGWQTRMNDIWKS